MNLINVDKNHTQLSDMIVPEKLLSGGGATSLWNAFSDKSEQFHVGLWSSEPCALKVSYGENELCVITQGDVKVTDNKGRVFEYTRGDAFDFPAGFKGVWESVTPVTKIYAVFEQEKPND